MRWVGICCDGMHPIYQLPYPRHKEKVLKDAIAYIHDHLQDPIRLADLARVVHMSPNYFVKQFKQAMGISPYRYVTQCRIQTAQKLLRHQHLAISEVAH